MRTPSEFETHPATYPYARGLGYYRAVCRKVVDGDTYDALVDLGVNSYVYLTIRLHGFDTPEIFHPKTDEERRRGLAAKARVVELIDGKPVLLRTFKDQETFGRYVADVCYFSPVGDGQTRITNLADTLTAEGFAK